MRLGLQEFLRAVMACPLIASKKNVVSVQYGSALHRADTCLDKLVFQRIERLKGLPQLLLATETDVEANPNQEIF